MKAIQAALVLLCWAMAIANWWVPGFHQYWLIGTLPKLHQVDRAGEVR